VERCEPRHFTCAAVNSSARGRDEFTAAANTKARSGIRRAANRISEEFLPEDPRCRRWRNGSLGERIEGAGCANGAKFVATQPAVADAEFSARSNGAIPCTETPRGQHRDVESACSEVGPFIDFCCHCGRRLGSQ